MAIDIGKRIKELEAEYQAGGQRLAALQQEQQRVGNTMQRITGAIAILRELLASADQLDQASPAPSPAEPVLAAVLPIEE